MIREATEEDIPRVLEIEREAISPPWTHGALLSEMYSTATYFAVVPFAHEGSSPQGRGLSIPPSHILGFIIMRRAADEGELYQVAVDAAHRRQGIADELMEAALVWAHDCGIASIYLEVRKSNEAAIALYAKHGFIQVGFRKEYFTEPFEDAVVMVNKK